MSIVDQQELLVPATRTLSKNTKNHTSPTSGMRSSGSTSSKRASKGLGLASLDVRHHHPQHHLAQNHIAKSRANVNRLLSVNQTTANDVGGPNSSGSKQRARNTAKTASPHNHNNYASKANRANNNNNNKINASECVCSGCQARISDRYLLSAGDRYWHENCLKCDRCKAKLGELGASFYTKSDMNLCRQDYLEMFGRTAICSVCDKLIYASEMVMRAKENVYHLECFACQLCGQRFCVGDKFYLFENKIVCQFDFEEHILPIQNSLQLTLPATYLNHHHHHQQHQQQQLSDHLASETADSSLQCDKTSLCEPTFERAAGSQQATTCPLAAPSCETEEWHRLAGPPPPPPPPLEPDGAQVYDEVADRANSSTVTECNLGAVAASKGPQHGLSILREPSKLKVVDDAATNMGPQLDCHLDHRTADNDIDGATSRDTAAKEDKRLAGVWTPSKKEGDNAGGQQGEPLAPGSGQDDQGLTPLDETRGRGEEPPASVGHFGQLIEIMVSSIERQEPLVGDRHGE